MEQCTACLHEIAETRGDNLPLRMNAIRNNLVTICATVQSCITIMSQAERQNRGIPIIDSTLENPKEIRLRAIKNGLAKIDIQKLRNIKS